MKSLKVAALAFCLATPSFAGGLSEPVMEPEIVEEDAATGSRAGIIVPIMAVVLIGLAMSNSN